MKDHFSAFIGIIFLYFALVTQSFVNEIRIKLKPTSITAHQRQSAVATSEYMIDAKSIKDGSLVEYTSAKGSKRLAIVSKRVGAHLDVLNDAKKSFSVPISKNWSTPRLSCFSAIRASIGAKQLTGRFNSNTQRLSEML